MDFRTIVPLPSVAPQLTPDSHVLMLGSCFAEHVGHRLVEALGEEQCCVNPFGVLYNPLSIAQALHILMEDPRKTKGTIVPYIFEGRDGLWHSWLHSIHYSAPMRELCEARCLESISRAQQMLERADLLIVTFGTNRCYCLDDGKVVANCHKELPTTFTEHDCTVEEIVEVWQPLMEKLHRRYPSLQIVFTMSPYRYRKYGYHASQLAKARLLLAIEALTPQEEANGGGVYFPAYEIVLDELRDYRFYAADMLHPSEQAVDYIWERFCEWSFSDAMTTHYQHRIKELKKLRHHENY